MLDPWAVVQNGGKGRRLQVPGSKEVDVLQLGAVPLIWVDVGPLEREVGEKCGQLWRLKGDGCQDLAPPYVEELEVAGNNVEPREGLCIVEVELRERAGGGKLDNNLVKISAPRTL